MLEAPVIKDEHVEILLSDLLEQYGYDFTGYSRASLKRRITRLYSLDKVISFAEFRYKIANDQAYFKRFVEQITVNVTEMFRDPSFFRTLREDVGTGSPEYVCNGPDETIFRKLYPVGWG